MGQHIALEVDRRQTRTRGGGQFFDVVIRRQHKGNAGRDPVVCALTGAFDHDVGGTIDLDQVIAQPPRQTIIAGAAVQHVIARAAVNRVIARAAGQAVGRCRAGDRVIARCADQMFKARHHFGADAKDGGSQSQVKNTAITIGVGRPVDRVIAGAAIIGVGVDRACNVDPVIPGIAENRVGPGAIGDRVIAGMAMDRGHIGRRREQVIAHRADLPLPRRIGPGGIDRVAGIQNLHLDLAALGQIGHAKAAIAQAGDGQFGAGHAKHEIAQADARCTEMGGMDGVIDIVIIDDDETAIGQRCDGGFVIVIRG